MTVILHILKHIKINYINFKIIVISSNMYLYFISFLNSCKPLSC